MEKKVGQPELAMTQQGATELSQVGDGDFRSMVEAELARIKVHPIFQNTTRMKRFLNYVVEETLAGRGDLLKGYSIGLEVFDRPDDFDPQADTIVRVHAGQLRRRLDLYYSNDGKNSPVRILVPKGRYTPIFDIRCETESVATSNPQKVVATSNPQKVVAAIEVQNRPSIVVLSFQNLAKDRDTRNFAKGVTAEIGNALVQFRYIKIIAHTANVIDEATSPPDLKAIADKTNAQFALTGNVRRSGNLMRVSVNLISVETGEHVYSKIFDREYTPENLFDIQEEIASYIAANVAAPFGVINRFNRRSDSVKQSSMATYEAFLKYYEMGISPTTNKVLFLLDEFEKITQDTPRFSSAWAIVSLLNTFLVTQLIPSLEPERRLKAALKAGRRAAAIDPENALAFSALFQANFHAGHLDVAETMAAKAIMLNPNDYNTLAYYAITRSFRRDVKSALAFQKAALELVPQPPTWFYVSSLICSFQNKDFSGVMDTIGDITPNSPVAFHLLGLSSMGHLGMKDEAEAFLSSVYKIDSEYSKNLLATVKHSYVEAGLWALVEDGLRKAGLNFSA